MLKRLKQKDEEWKRAQREWNKVWREMEQKCSTSHWIMLLTFKQADKKLLTVKQLVSEISTVKVEQQNKRLHPLTPKPQEQLNYDFKDNEVLFDILKLAEVFINKSSTYSAHDRKSCYNFTIFHVFVFSIPTETIETALVARGRIEKSSEEENEKGDVEMSENGSDSSKRDQETQIYLKMS